MAPKTVRLYGLAIGIAKAGTGLFFLINTWLVIDITGRPSSGAIALVVTVLPGILVAPFLGVWVDRSRPAKLAVLAELLRGIALAAYALLIQLARRQKRWPTASPSRLPSAPSCRCCRGARRSGAAHRPS